ncbi:MAG: hypothetical protein ACI8Z1_003631 [Candidatus Azotimanducaceae bacterium]|jgi:hypothetical protein
MNPRHLSLLALATMLGLCSIWMPAHADNLCVGDDEAVLNCHAVEVKDLLGRWARAWGEGDIENYLNLYSNIKSPRDDMNRAAWEEHRRARIGPGKRIELNLKLESMGLEDSGIFDVIFNQHYQSATYEDRVRKRVFLVRESGELKIWKEEVLP